MPIDFWLAIGSNSISGRIDVEVAVAGVAERLRKLNLTDLAEFQDQLGCHIDRLDRRDLASVPVALSGWLTVEQTADHFLYARCACVLAGENSVNGALEDAACFARFVAPQLQSAELLLYLAHNECSSRTSQRMTGVWIPN